jgi:hypothetical protein
MFDHLYTFEEVENIDNILHGFKTFISKINKNLKHNITHTNNLFNFKYITDHNFTNLLCKSVRKSPLQFRQFHIEIYNKRTKTIITKTNGYLLPVFISKLHEELYYKKNV